MPSRCLMHACRQSLASSAARYQWKPVDPPPQTLIPSLGRETLVDEQMDLLLPRSALQNTHVLQNTAAMAQRRLFVFVSYSVCCTSDQNRQQLWQLCCDIKYFLFSPNQPMQTDIALHHSDIQYVTAYKAVHNFHIQYMQV